MQAVDRGFAQLGGSCAFGCDFRDFQRLTCTVKDHHFSVYLNDRRIFDREQHLTVGRIIGIRIAFEGAGEIREVSLRSADQPSGGDLFPLR